MDEGNQFDKLIYKLVHDNDARWNKNLTLNSTPILLGRSSMNTTRDQMTHPSTLLLWCSTLAKIGLEYSGIEATTQTGPRKRTRFCSSSDSITATSQVSFMITLRKRAHLRQGRGR